MKLLFTLLTLVAVVVALGVWVMVRLEPGSLKKYLKKAPPADNPHRGYPVEPPSREAIVRRTPLRTDPPPRTEPPPRSPNLDAMRSGMQKMAYEMVGDQHSPETKAKFKQGMTEFASHDPMVHLIAQRVHQLAIDNPGQLQSKIYRHFPEFDKEQVRYGLYFADELGLVRRKKKGNTYQLFPAGSTYDD